MIGPQAFDKLRDFASEEFRAETFICTRDEAEAMIEEYDAACEEVIDARHQLNEVLERSTDETGTAA